MEVAARHLLFHGSIVLLIGLLCGVPYGIAIVKKKSDEVIRAWKLAHGALSLGATTMFGVSGILSFVQVAALTKWCIAVPFIVSGYGFCFALTLEPLVEQRGLSWSGNASNRVVFVGNSIGAWSSLLGAIVLVYAAYRSL